MDRTPPIGQTVQTPWGPDWVAQVRIGDEQGVLLWGSIRKRHAPGDWLP